MSIEFRGVYDGELLRQCGACSHAWPCRFATPGLDELAASLAASINDQAADRVGKDGPR